MTHGSLIVCLNFLVSKSVSDSLCTNPLTVPSAGCHSNIAVVAKKRSCECDVICGYPAI